MEQSGKPVGSGVYMITFPNGVYYIGQAENLSRRKSQHIRDAKNERHTNDRFQKCFNKYGGFKFEVIERCENGRLNEIETQHIGRHIENELCCNVCSAGRSRAGVVSSDKTKRKISAYQFLAGKTKPVDMFNQNMDLIGSFDSINAASIAVGADKADVAKSCKSGGYYNVKGNKFLFSLQRITMTSMVSNMIKL